MKKGLLSLVMSSVLIASCGGGGGEGSISVKFKKASVEPSDLQNASSFRISWEVDYSGPYAVKIYQSRTESVPDKEHLIAEVRCDSSSDVCKGSSGSIDCNITKSSPNTISCNVGSSTISKPQLVNGNGYIVLVTYSLEESEDEEIEEDVIENEEIEEDVKSVQVTFP